MPVRCAPALHTLTENDLSKLTLSPRHLLGSRLAALSLALGLALGTLGAGSAAAATPPLRDPTAAAADCAACHGSTAVLPAKHKAVKTMKWAQCVECHEPKDADSSLVGKLPAAHMHALAGEGCQSCHGEGKPAAVPTAKCTSCHDPDKLVAKTAAVKPKNPHTSPHYGKELDCDNCHLQHGKSLNFCNDCHEFKFQVP